MFKEEEIHLSVLCILFVWVQSFTVSPCLLTSSHLKRNTWPALGFRGRVVMHFSGGSSKICTIFLIASDLLMNKQSMTSYNCWKHSCILWVRLDREYTQFHILVGGMGRNVPPLFRSVPGFSNNPLVVRLFIKISTVVAFSKKITQICNYQRIQIKKNNTENLA